MPREPHRCLSISLYQCASSLQRGVRTGSCVRTAFKTAGAAGAAAAALALSLILAGSGSASPASSSSAVHLCAIFESATPSALAFFFFFSYQVLLQHLTHACYLTGVGTCCQTQSQTQMAFYSHDFLFTA